MFCHYHDKYDKHFDSFERLYNSSNFTSLETISEHQNLLLLYDSLSFQRAWDGQNRLRDVTMARIKKSTFKCLR